MEWPPPPPPLPPLPRTTMMGANVGSERYSVVITYEPEMAAEWVRRLRLQEPPPTENRIIGFSHLWSDLTTDGGLRLLDYISFCFSSCVLVLQLAPPTVDGAVHFPEDLRSFLVNPRNLFAGVAIEEASRVMALHYGVEPQWTIDFYSYVGTGRPHLRLARSLLRWTGELVGGWPMFAVENSVLSQMLGNFMAEEYPIFEQGDLPWF